MEFQLKSPKLLHSINLNRLKSQARIGCTVHSRVRVQQEVLDQLDFRATPNQAKELKNFVMIPNVVAFPEVVPQYRVGPRKAWKALYVGRLDKVKLTTIRNFVELCCKHHIKFELAGPLSKQEEVLSYVENLPQGSLIGEIDTRAYLEEHGSEYLFVGGVGQVPLEAAAVNLPAWVSPDVEDYNRGAFLTANNLENLRQWNCTIKPGKIPEELAPGNAEEFFEAVGMASVSGDLCSLEVFRVREALRAQLSEDVVWGQYLRLIEAGAGGKLDEIKSRKSRDRRSVAIE